MKPAPNLLARACGGGLGALLLYAGFSKITGSPEFEKAVAILVGQSRPAWLALVIGLPALEVCLGLHLLIGRSVEQACRILGVLLPAMSVVLLNMARHDLACGCLPGGLNAAGILPWLNLFPGTRNSCLMAAVAILLLRRPGAAAVPADKRTSAMPAAAWSWPFGRRNPRP